MRFLNNKKPKVIDLFSGCGGLNEGFKQAGFLTSVSNDIWVPAGKTFEKNNKDGEFILGDITQKKIRDRIIKEGKGSKVLVGGPPCQAYSMAGSRNVDDPRGKLFEDYVKIVKAIKPKYFVMENVKGLISMEHDKPRLSITEKKILSKIKKLENKKHDLLLKRKKSKNTPKIKFNKSEEKLLEEIKEELRIEKKLTSSLRVKVTDTIKKKFSSFGYDVHIKVLNAADYGVPQKRQRVIIIGGLDGYDVSYPEPAYQEKSNSKNLELFKTNLSNWVTVKEAIDDLKNKPEDISFNHIFTRSGKDFQKKINKTPIGRTVYGGFSDAYFRCPPNEPSRTVKENHGGVFIHYDKNRFMTPRELARLQSFDDKFIFEGSKSQILVQIGNAVPPKLGCHIANTLKEYL
jgi:DNA (cytosine-5)-methyltransferase 1